MNLKGLLTLLTLSFFVLFFSCTKINEATELGGDLIPAVDNVTTFDTLLTVNTAYFPYEDSSVNLLGENMALGRLNDPVFGTTTGDMYFNLSSPLYNSSPFSHADSVIKIDSVILSLAYQGAYGDTNSQIQVQVSEITDPTFYDTTAYRYDHPGFSTASGLGTKTFAIREVKDSIRIGLKKDTVKVANVIRIPLNSTLGTKLKDFGAGANLPYFNDSLFRRAFRGLAVKTMSAAGNGALAYFNLSDFTGSRLIVYYQKKIAGGLKDTATVSFTHNTYSQANSIRKIPGGAYLAGVTNPSSQNLYVQSSPSGSYVGMKIPGLDAFPNKVIHRAELIVSKVADPLETIFTIPNRLFLDHKGTNSSRDSAYLFDNDLAAGADGSLNYASFGGDLRSDNTYRFNITRHVQGIVTRKDRNDSLRLFAPFRTNVFARGIGIISISSLQNIAAGRVVLVSGSNANAVNRLRLRIIYSNL